MKRTRKSEVEPLSPAAGEDLKQPPLPDDVISCTMLDGISVHMLVPLLEIILSRVSDIKRVFDKVNELQRDSAVLDRW